MAAPTPPPGFVLDAPTNVPGPPPGFVLDQPQMMAPPEAVVPETTGRFSDLTPQFMGGTAPPATDIPRAPQMPGVQPEAPPGVAFEANLDVVRGPGSPGAYNRALAQHFGLDEQTMSQLVAVDPEGNIFYRDPETGQSVPVDIESEVNLRDLASLAPDLATMGLETVGGIRGATRNVGKVARGRFGTSRPIAGGAAGASLGALLGEGIRAGLALKTGQIDDPVAAMESAATTAGFTLAADLGMGLTAHGILRGIFKVLGVDVGRGMKTTEIAGPEVAAGLPDARQQREQIIRETGVDPGMTVAGAMRQGEELPTERTQAVLREEMSLMETNAPNLARAKNQQRRAMQAYGQTTGPQAPISEAEVGEGILPVVRKQAETAERQAAETGVQAERSLEESLQDIERGAAQAQSGVDAAVRESRDLMATKKSVIEEPESAEYERIIKRSRRKGQTIAPVSVRAMGRKWKKTLNSDIVQRAIAEDKTMADDLASVGIIIRREERPLPSVAPQHRTKVTRTEKEVDLGQIQRALQQVRRLRRSMGKPLGTGLTEERMLIDIEKALVRDRRRLLENDPKTFFKIMDVERRWAKIRDQYDKSVLGKFLQKDGRGNYSLSDKQALDALLKNPKTAREFMSALFNPRMTEFLPARRSLKEAIYRSYLDGPGKSGTVSLAAHRNFFRGDRGRAMQALLTPQEYARLQKPFGAKTLLEQAQKREKEVLGRLRDRFDLDIASWNPEDIVGRTFDPKNDLKAARLMNMLKSRAPQMAEELEAAYKQRIQSKIFQSLDPTSRAAMPVANNTKALVLDARRRNWIERVLGSEYMNKLENLHRMAVRYEQKPDEILRNPQAMFNAVKDLTRAYVGLFTRPGRMVTAYTRLSSRSHQKFMDRILSDAETFNRLAKMNKAYGSVLTALTIGAGLGVIPGDNLPELSDLPELNL